jgi:hypothetical protein
MSIIVAVTGMPRVGKNTLGEYLQSAFEAEAIAIADPLYEEVADAFGVSIQELKTREWKETPQNCLAIWQSKDPDFRQMMKARGEDVITPRTSRYLLRYWGTEYRRMRDPFYWANASFPALKYAGERPVVITDMRAYDRTFTEFCFFREYAAQNDKGFALIEVLRKNGEAWGHSSDDRFPEHMIDLTVTNVEGDPAAMCEAVYNFLSCTNNGGHQ